jgi:hypothetical protein
MKTNFLKPTEVLKKEIEKKLQKELTWYRKKIRNQILDLNAKNY